MENTTIIARLLAILCLILSGVIAVSTANADSHLPNCKADVGCLVDNSIDWETVTAAEVQTIIDSGANVNAKGDHGTTPLHAATYHGHAEVISVLIQAGADVNAKDDNSWTPLDGAAIFGNAEVIPVLVKAGADVNAKGQDGDTPLHIAAFGGNAEVIPILLKAGADVHAKDNNGNTPLHWAALKGNAEVIPVLIKHGAYIQATNNDGDTPLDVARAGKQWNAVKILEGGSGLASPSCFNIIRGKPEQIVRVNGVRMTLLIDTGASITALSYRQARAAGVQPTGEAEFTLADNSVVVHKTGSANISLGGELTGNFPVSIGDGKGLLGRDILDEFACQ